MNFSPLSQSWSCLPECGLWVFLEIHCSPPSLFFFPSIPKNGAASPCPSVLWIGCYNETLSCSISRFIFPSLTLNNPASSSTVIVLSKSLNLGRENTYHSLPPLAVILGPSQLQENSFRWGKRPQGFEENRCFDIFQWARLPRGQVDLSVCSSYWLQVTCRERSAACVLSFSCCNQSWMMEFAVQNKF